VKCFGQPVWVPLGLEVESLVVGGQAECRIGGAGPGEQVVRNYSLRSYEIGVRSECLSTRLHYPGLMQASVEGKVWECTITVPFGSDQGGRVAGESQVIAKLKDVIPATDQNISIDLTAAARGATGRYVLPEFIIQVDVTE
jgi:hypothetical protein